MSLMHCQRRKSRNFPHHRNGFLILSWAWYVTLIPRMHINSALLLLLPKLKLYISFISLSLIERLLCLIAIRPQSARCLDFFASDSLVGCGVHFPGGRSTLDQVDFALFVLSHTRHRANARFIIRRKRNRTRNLKITRDFPLCVSPSTNLVVCTWTRPRHLFRLRKNLSGGSKLHFFSELAFRANASFVLAPSINIRILLRTWNDLLLLLDNVDETGFQWLFIYLDLVCAPSRSLGSYVSNDLVLKRIVCSCNHLVNAASQLLLPRVNKVYLRPSPCKRHSQLACLCGSGVNGLDALRTSICQ